MAKMKHIYNQSIGTYEPVVPKKPIKWIVKNPTKPYVKADQKIKYDLLTVPELKGIARERKLVGYSKFKKVEIIKLLEDNDDAPRD